MFSNVIQFDNSQIEFLATTLSGVFYNEPGFKYLMPDEEIRRTHLPGFIRHFVRSSQIFGEIYSTENIDAGVVWIGGGDTWTLERLVRTAASSMRCRLDGPSLRRCISLCLRLKTVQDRLARKPHRYLMVLGLKPSKLENSAAVSLLQPLLSQADSDRIPCYLETFSEKDLPFYKNFGFRVEGAGRISADGPSFWAMIREPGGFEKKCPAARHSNV
jgi:hypothetical protein